MSTAPHRRHVLIGLGLIPLAPLLPLASVVAKAHPVLPSLSAGYRVSFQPIKGREQAQVWRLQRTPARIVWSKGGALDEVWQSEASGIALQRVMHDERHVIEYSAGELRTLGVAMDWRELATLISEQDLAALTSVRSQRQTAGQVLLRGQLAGEQVELLWDEALSLPIRLTRAGPKGRVTYLRQAVDQNHEAASARDEARSANYSRIDAADFGDMEYEPAVRMAMALDEKLGWRRAHRH